MLAADGCSLGVASGRAGLPIQADPRRRAVRPGHGDRRRGAHDRQRARQLTGQSVVVENKPGAEGQIGAPAAAQAAPDGCTLFVAARTTQAMNQHIYKSLMSIR